MKEKEWEPYALRSDREISWNLLAMNDRSLFGEEEILSAHRKVLEGDWSEAEKLIKLYRTCSKDQLLERKKNMETNRDLLQILKNYPAGTQLWSPLYGVLYLDHVEPRDSITDVPLICCRKTPGPAYKKEDTIWFYDDGSTGDENFNVAAKCNLFPPDDEDKTLGAWIKWEINNPPFKEGDVLRREDGKVIRILGIEGNEYRYTSKGLVERDYILRIDRKFSKISDIYVKPKPLSELKKDDIVYWVNNRYRIREIIVVSNYYDENHFTGGIYIQSGYELRLSNDRKLWLNASEAKGHTSYKCFKDWYFTKRQDAEDYVIKNYKKRVKQLEKQIKKASDEKSLLLDDVKRYKNPAKWVLTSLNHQ